MLLLAAPALGQVPAGNLIENPGAEADTGSTEPNCGEIPDVSDWDEGNGDFTAVKYGTGTFPASLQGGGANFFAGGCSPSTTSSAEQLIDVSSGATDIDSGTVTADLGGYLGGYLDHTDTAKVTATFRDAGNSSLGQLVIGPVTASDRNNQTTLLPRAASATVPAGTRSIRLVLLMTRTTGNSNDGFADILSLTLDGSGGPPPPGSGEPGGPPQQAPPLPPECQNPTTLLVTCAEFARPAVCGPTGTIFPACHIPFRLPTVCGPSFGTITAPCQSKGPYTVACGGFGTILPQCNLPQPNVPQVCGPSSGTILPACTGANNPVTVCGPSFGSVVPACNFAARITATVVNLNSGKGQIDLVLKNCPAKGGSSRARAAQGRPTRPPPFSPRVRCPGYSSTYDVVSGTVTLADWQAAEKSSLVEEAQWLAGWTSQKAWYCPLVQKTYSCEGTVGGTEQEKTLYKLLAIQNAGHFLARARRFIDQFVPPHKSWRLVDPDRTRITVRDGLTSKDLPPLQPYRPPTPLFFNYSFESDSRAFAQSVELAVREYEVLMRPRKQAGGSSLATPPSAEPAVVGRSKRIVRRFKLRRGRKKRIRIKLKRKDVRKLARNAGRRRVLPVRIIVSFRAKPRPVARIYDIRLPIKPKKAKRKKR